MGYRAEWNKGRKIGTTVRAKSIKYTLKIMTDIPFEKELNTNSKSER